MNLSPRYSHNDIHIMRGFLGVCVWGGGGGGGREEACVIGEILLCFAVEQSKQCLKQKASSGKRKQKERLQAGLMLTTQKRIVNRG